MRTYMRKAILTLYLKRLLKINFNVMEKFEKFGLQKFRFTYNLTQLQGGHYNHIEAEYHHEAIYYSKHCLRIFGEVLCQ